MVLKVTSPLFAVSASGSIAGVGTYSRLPDGSFIVTAVKTGNPNPNKDNLRMRESFKEAMAIWITLPKTLRPLNGRFYWIINPRWPDYWAQWVLDHPEDF